LQVGFADVSTNFAGRLTGNSGTVT